ncbi:MAG: DUF2721 domain-containing protein [Gammaproteobacteria bacterium]|nr:DUF2721 domain-containing protein [Gammaproteobacteria bacterium]MBU2059054.1 DUF2721 domain-containing protein [Gammaproteobacteria bacterium]MBU2176220.1 DUF2721 domain-containing protein [Gammaproteobacteria bacterium]MBU2247919.1 DUF2721 domain-containing protein [Gammaproteobacteria bacterium]MBU2344125.1 DUF2721 domain-containing protein [Gammaproteobacteria bacterium]
MTMTTPALLFPAISLLLLAYTNRFLVLAQLIRQLNTREGGQVRDMAKRQIENLRQRMFLIRSMQRWGVISFVLCTLSMFFLFMQWALAGQIAFAASLASLILSLLVSLYEIQISCNAIKIELESMEQEQA